MNNNMKSFIITVDTEGDNLWNYKQGDVVATNNVQYIPRFQQLCEKYEFKPVYLANYEMLCSDDFIKYIKPKEKENLCEVGLHLHAWNNPPLFDIGTQYGGNPYLIEFPKQIMYDKFDVLYRLYCDRLGHKPTSHRSGRWAMNEHYFEMLQYYGITVDCSVTPGVDWSNSKGAFIGGTDYTNSPSTSYYVGSVCEVPHTVIKSHKPLFGTIKHRIKTLVFGECLELRPAIFSYPQMKEVVEIVSQERQSDYVEFMIHSSELMPSGSPYMVSKDDIEEFYSKIEKIFSFIKSKGYVGQTLKEYYNNQQL